MSIYDHFTTQEFEILRKRAERLARPIEDRRIDNPLEVLIVSAGGESYAIPAKLVAGVYDNVTVVPVPCVPTFIVGVTNIRGHVLPVMNLAAFLNITRAAASLQALVVIVHEDFNVALLVDETHATRTISLTDVTPIPEHTSLAQRSHLKGFLADGTTLLDIAMVLSESLQQINANSN